MDRMAITRRRALAFAGALTLNAGTAAATGNIHEAERLVRRTAIGAFGRLVARDRNANAALAPTCLVSALMMIAAGADGATRHEIMAGLSWWPGDGDRVSAALASLGALDRDMRGHAGKAEVATANGLFAGRDAVLNPHYLQAVGQSLDAKAETVDFAAAPTLAHVNNWVSRATRGMVPAMIDRIDPGLQLLIASATYFKCDWQDAFDRRLTRPRQFHTASGAVRDVPMMVRSEERLPYLDRPAFQAVRLPYLGNAYQLVLLAPRAADRKALASWIDAATEEDWDVAFDRGRYALMKGELVVPKLALRTSVEMKDSLGSDPVFGPALRSDADLGRIGTPRMRAGRIAHGVAVRMDESGTVAAGATVAAMMEVSIVDRFSMVLDRPYLFAIQHVRSGAIAFLGYVADPSLAKVS